MNITKLTLLSIFLLTSSGFEEYYNISLNSPISDTQPSTPTTTLSTASTALTITTPPAASTTSPAASTASPTPDTQSSTNTLTPQEQEAIQLALDRFSLYHTSEAILANNTSEINQIISQLKFLLSDISTQQAHTKQLHTELLNLKQQKDNLEEQIEVTNDSEEQIEVTNDLIDQLKAKIEQIKVQENLIEESILSTHRLQLESEELQSQIASLNQSSSSALSHLFITIHAHLFNPTQCLKAIQQPSIYHPPLNTYDALSLDITQSISIPYNTSEIVSIRAITHKFTYGNTDSSYIITVHKSLPDSTVLYVQQYIIRSSNLRWKVENHQLYLLADDICISRCVSYDNKLKNLHIIANNIHVNLTLSNSTLIVDNITNQSQSLNDCILSAETIDCPNQHNCTYIPDTIIQAIHTCLE